MDEGLAEEEDTSGRETGLFGADDWIFIDDEEARDARKSAREPLLEGFWEEIVEEYEDEYGDDRTDPGEGLPKPGEAFYLHPPLRKQRRQRLQYWPQKYGTTGL